jgi:predicted dienelactone hydrolase
MRAAAFVVALVTVACTSTASRGASGSSSTISLPTASTAAPTTYPVKETHVTVVDLQGASGKQSVSTLVVYPTGAPGPFPLVVFSHGYRSLAEFYVAFLEQVASYGFVVAGPDFPDVDPATHPREISLVVDGLATAGSGLPAGIVDRDHLAVMGHSLGGADVDAIMFNSCCRDDRIDAAVTFEGVPPVAFPHGTYAWKGAPLLMVVGDADPLVAPDTGTAFLARVTSTAYLLTVVGGAHGGGMDVGEVGHGDVTKTLRLFLDAYLKGDRTARAQLAGRFGARREAITASG